MSSCKHNVAVLYTVFSIYHAVFVNTQVNETHSLLSSPQLETADELQNVVFPSFKRLSHTLAKSRKY